MAKRLRTPVGNLQPRFDRVAICTNVDKRILRRRLPYDQLVKAAHSFKIEKRRGKGGARIVLTCLPDLAALRLLKDYEPVLGTYRITYVEMAFDLPAVSLDDARKKRDWLVQRLEKIRPARHKLLWVETWKDGSIASDAALTKNGWVREPSVTFEEATSHHGLTVYIRHQKLAVGKHARLVVRTEFKTRRSRPVRQRYGGDQLDNLLATDFEDQAAKLFVLKELNRERLASLIFPQELPRMRTHKTIKDRSGAATEAETRRLLKVADLAIMIMEQRHWKVTRTGRLADVIEEKPSIELPAIREPLPELFWRHSPTQIKGRWRNCRENLSIKDRAKRLLEHLYGRKKQRVTPKKLDACFDRIPLRRVRVRL